jgi:uncharacterized membrane protein YuzA (DUF378 family)
VRAHLRAMPPMHTLSRIALILVAIAAVIQITLLVLR